MNIVIFCLIAVLWVVTPAFAVPTTPTALHETGPVTGSSVLIIWAPNADADFASFRVYRKVSGGSYGAAIATITLASAAAVHRPPTQYLATSSAGVTYCYVITAVDNSAVESAVSNEICHVFTGVSARCPRGSSCTGSSPGTYVLNETGGRIIIEAGSGFILKE